MVPMRNAVLIPTVHQAFTAEGTPRDPATESAIDVLFDDLAWWADALRRARARGELAPALFRPTSPASTAAG